MMRMPDKMHQTSRVRAWRLPPPAGPHAALVRWLVHTPRSLEHWVYYLVAVFHLREVEGLPVAAKRYPEAAHELHIARVAPESRVDYYGRDPLLLLPAALHEQFHGLSDEEAVVAADGLVEKCVRGQLDLKNAHAWKLDVLPPTEPTARHRFIGPVDG